MLDRRLAITPQHCHATEKPRQMRMLIGRPLQERDRLVHLAMAQLELDPQRLRIRITSRQRIENPLDLALHLRLVKEQGRQRQPAEPVLGIGLDVLLEILGDTGLPVREVSEAPSEQIVMGQ